MAETILIFRIGNLGDTLVAMPAIYAIRQRYPQAKLVLLTERSRNIKNVSARTILEPTGWFDSIVDFESRGGILSYLGLANELSALNPKMAFALTPRRTFWQRWRDRLFFLLVSVNLTYIRPNATQLDLYERKPLQKAEHEWLRLLKVVDDGAISRDFSFPLRDETRLRVLGLLNEFDLLTDRDSKILAICPGSKMPAKIWPLVNYLHLGKKILATYPKVKLVVLGGEEDREVGDDLCREWGGRSRNLAGTLSVYESAAVIEKCEGYIGNDSGPMHLAAMLGKQCIALFSARDLPGKWDPYGVGHVVLRHEMECSGCMLEICDRDNACLRKISVDDVYDHVAKLLG